ncbi:MAG: efflux RND transporter periplasmic adaptor subunit [Gammaproteobacteria bacterium]
MTEQEDGAVGVQPQVRGFLRRRRGLAIAVGGVLVALLVIGFLMLRHSSSPGSGRGRAAQQGGANAPVAVSIATATKGDVAIRIPALGSITPLATVTVRTQISGQLQTIAFKEGQLVRQGDFLAQIDPRPYESALEQAKANLQRDEALLADAQLDLKRYVGLLAEDAIAQQQIDTQKALAAQYEGTVAGDRAQVKTAALNLQYTHIVSPIAGRVGLRQVDAGNYVTPGDANGIVVITQLQPITALFSIPEDNIATVMRRMKEGASLPVEAYDRSDATKIADGTLSTVDNQIDPTTGTFKLRAMFDNAEGSLYPNQFVNVRLLVNTLRDQVIVPNAAVNRGAPNGTLSTFVYLVRPDNTVAVRPVVLGPVDGERVAVTSGLAAGDVVVTAGGDRLRDGAPVELPAAASAEPGAAGARPGARPPGAGERKRNRPSSGSGS